MRVSNDRSDISRKESFAETFQRERGGQAGRPEKPQQGGGTVSGPIPVEPDGGIGDGAGPIPGTEGGSPRPGENDITTLAIGEEGGDPGAGGPTEPIGGETTAGTRGNDTLIGTDGDDRINAKGGNDTITTGRGDDTVRAGSGDDVIEVTGVGTKNINGGSGEDTLRLKGQAVNYTIDTRQNGSTVYTSADGSEITARNIELVEYTGAVAPPPPVDTGFTASFALEPNEIGATSLEISDGKAVLTGPETNFTFTGVDPSALAFDGPLIATGGSGTINGEETTAVAADGGTAVLTVSSGFNISRTQFVNATFANGAILDTSVIRPV